MPGGTVLGLIAKDLAPEQKMKQLDNRSFVSV